jgi:hypothetical protein
MRARDEKEPHQGDKTGGGSSAISSEKRNASRVDETRPTEFEGAANLFMSSNSCNSAPGGSVFAMETTH